jgi:hypothetical protein
MKTKRAFLTGIFIIGLTIYASAQADIKVPDKKTYFGFSGGYGFIGPKIINEQLDIHADNHGLVFSRGNPRINVAYILGMGVDHFINKNLEIRGELEFGWGIKQITVLLGSGYFNSLVRLSGGVSANYHFFFEKSNSIYFGGGVNLNSLTLSAFDQDITGKSTPAGYSFQVGLLTISYNSRNRQLKFFYELQGNIVKGNNNENGVNNVVSELSFSGISLKGGFRF